MTGTPSWLSKLSNVFFTIIDAASAPVRCRRSMCRLWSAHDVRERRAVRGIWPRVNLCEGSFAEMPGRDGRTRVGAQAQARTSMLCGRTPQQRGPPARGPYDLRQAKDQARTRPHTKPSHTTGVRGLAPGGGLGARPPENTKPEAGFALSANTPRVPRVPSAGFEPATPASGGQCSIP